MYKGFTRSIIYMGIWVILSFPLGRLIRWLNPRWDQWPFQSWAWEDEGRIYEKLGIRLWKDNVPDVSKFASFIVPKKEIVGRPDAAVMRDMIAETCVAEVIHGLLCFTGLMLIPLWPGIGGRVTYFIYLVFGNLPFIMIQRYNRPRFQKMLRAVEARERRFKHACTDTVQY